MKLLYRAFFHVLGQFVLAFGVAFSSNSHLGLSPVNSFPFAINAASGVRAGTCVSLVFCAYVLIQILILRKEFKTKYFLQAIYATMFGYFVDLTKYILGDFTIPTYAGQLAMLAISIVLIATGLTMYLAADIVPMPMEGLTMAITQKLKRFTFHNVKVVLDCASVVMAALVLLVFLGPRAGFDAGIIREGTIITALAAGKLMGVISKFLTPPIKRLCFGTEKKPAPAA